MDIEKELVLVLSELPQEPPEETADILIERGLLKGNALVYRHANVPEPLTWEKNNAVQVTCTVCGQKNYLEKRYPGECLYCPDPFGFFDPWDKEEKKTGDVCRCPSCGAVCTAAHIRVFRSYGGFYKIDGTDCVTTHSAGNHLVILNWIVEKLCDKEANIVYRALKYDGFTVIGDKLRRLTGHYHNMGGVLSYYDEWQPRQQMRDEIDVVYKNQIIPFEAQEVYRTDSKHSAWEQYCNEVPEKVGIYPVGFFKLWTKHKNMENLIRSGYSQVVSAVLKDCTTKNFHWYGTSTIGFDGRISNAYIDWKKVRPREMLCIEKEQAEAVKQIKDIKAILGFAIYQWCKKTHGVKMSNADVEICHTFGEKNVLKELKTPVRGTLLPPIRYLHYLEKTVSSEKRDTQYLRDYWDMAETVYESLEDTVMWPKKLTEAHDNITKLYQAKKDERLNAMILKQSEKYEELCFQDSETGLCIRPVRSNQELIREGEKLSHCVARYATDVSKGNTMIFFIRKIKKTNQPFFTLEFKNGRVLQNRGKKNCERTPEVRLFEKKWLDFVENMKKTKGRKKDGKQGIAGITSA